MEEFLHKLLSVKVILSAVVAVLTIVLYIVIKKLADKYKKNQGTGEKVTVIRVLFSFLRLMTVIIGVLVILQINGVNISAMMAGLGIASAIVGLALQDFLKDIIMGVHILTDHFFAVGDCVEYDNGREGVIIGMTLKSTKIGDLDDHSVTTVCNRDITKIRRFGKRMDIDIPLSYTEDVRHVHETMEGLCRSVKELEDVSECEYKGTQAFENSAVMYRIRIFCEPNMRADVRRAALGIIRDGLLDAGIDIPFEQLDVHCELINEK